MNTEPPKDTTITDEDVYWDMPWGEKYPDKPPVEIIFEADKALARLLAEDVIFLSDHWWEKEWPEKARELTSLNVICNDVFAWGCADAEGIVYAEIQGLYDAWMKDRKWGSSKWCAIKRNQQPQPPVIEAMKKDGAWDETMDGLGENTLDAETQAHVAYATNILQA